MKALGGSLALAISSTPSEHNEAASLVVASGVDAGAAIVADCSFERDDVMVQATDDPPDLPLVLPKRATQGVEEHANMDVEIVPSCFDMERSQVEPEPDGHLTMGKPKISSAPCTDKSSKELIHMDANEPL
jgi:hypothetical protein